MKGFNFSVIVIILVSFMNIMSCSVQETAASFEGRLVYKLSSRMIDPNALDSTNYQVIYAKDSLLRIENFTKIGKQIYIKHIPKNRAYILMDLGFQKVAIQTIPEPSPNAGKYLFQPKKKSKTFAGQKAKAVQITIPNIDSTFMVYYLPNISPAYTEALPGIAGLPVKYTIFSNDEFIDFELVEFTEMSVNRDLFGIPSDHTIMTMDEFIELLKE